MYFNYLYFNYFTTLANSAANWDIRELVDLINKSLKLVSDDLQPVCYVDVPAIFEIPDQYIIFPETILANLEQIKVHKAPGPDELPNWVLRGYAS